MDELSLALGALAFLASVGLHAFVRRLRPTNNTVLVYSCMATLLFLCLGFSLWATHSSTVAALAALAAYAFSCELYVFLITFIVGSVSIARLLEVAKLGPSKHSVVSPEKMLATRLDGLTACYLIRRQNGLTTLSRGGRLVVALYLGLRSFFGHGRHFQGGCHRPDSPRTCDSNKAPSGNRCGIWLLVMAFLVCAVYRDHLMGKSLYLGNFDRLNSILNVQLTDVESLKIGDSAAWDNSMFMGRNTLALSFTVPTPLNRLLTLLPPRDFYWLTGDVSIGLVILAGWSAFGFIYNVVRDPFAAFVGGTLYQFSAISILYASQNTLSFAVLIDLPLLLLVQRATTRNNWCRCFFLECLLLGHLIFFCFLQEVSYAVLLFVCYSSFLAFSRRDLRLFLAASLALVVAAIFSFPRIYGIAQDMSQLRRQISDSFNMGDFDAVYHWQNFQAVDVLRWFNDGLFGRFFGEMRHLKNNINITEGTLLYSSALAPFLVLSGVFLWKGRWFGLLRAGNRENLFFYAGIAVGFAVIVSKQLYHLLFLIFLRVDFTHTRMLVAVLPFLCVIVAESLAYLRITLPPQNVGAVLVRFTGAGLLAVAVGAMCGYWSDVAKSSQAIAITASLKGFVAPFVTTAAGLFGSSWKASPASGKFVIWLYPQAVAEVDIAALTFLGFLLAVWLTRNRPFARSWVFVATGVLLVDQAWTFANFQINGSHVHSSAPFEDENSFASAPTAFSPPSPAQLAAMRVELDADNFRTVFTEGPDNLPPVTAPHMGAFWQLRLVEGYSSGVPMRLSMLPWPADTLGLRTLSFGRMRPEQLPWDLLGFLNVRFAVANSKALYENLVRSGTADTIPEVSKTENPAHVVPRAFFAEHVRCVKSEYSAAFAIRSTKGSTSRLIDPQIESIVETTTPLTISGGNGSIGARYSRDHIEITVSPAPTSRLLVLNELFTPWWRAREDGKPVPLYPANLVMRSVVVAPGARSITLDFKPFCNAANVGLFSIFALLTVCASTAILSRMGRSTVE